MKSYETFADLTSTSSCGSDNTRYGDDKRVRSTSNAVSLGKFDQQRYTGSRQSHRQDRVQNKRFLKSTKQKENRMSSINEKSDIGIAHNSCSILKPKMQKSKNRRKRDATRLRKFLEKKFKMNSVKENDDNKGKIDYLSGKIVDSVTDDTYHLKSRNLTKKNIKGLFRRKNEMSCDDSISLLSVTANKSRLDSTAETESSDNILLKNETFAPRKESAQQKSINTGVSQTSLHQCPMEAYLREKYRQPTEEEKRTILQLKQDVLILFNELQDLINNI